MLERERRVAIASTPASDRTTARASGLVMSSHIGGSGGADNWTLVQGAPGGRRSDRRSGSESSGDPGRRLTRERSQTRQTIAGQAHRGGSRLTACPTTHTTSDRSRRIMMMVRTACLVLLLTVLVVPSALAAPADDSFIAGYAAAVLEREFSLTAPSLRVENGVVTLAASDLTAADRARVIAQLEQIRGVTRVVVLEPGVQPPAPAASAAPEPPRVLAEWQTGVFPGAVLFKPPDPRP